MVYLRFRMFGHMGMHSWICSKCNALTKRTRGNLRMLDVITHIQSIRIGRPAPHTHGPTNLQHHTHTQQWTVHCLHSRKRHWWYTIPTSQSQSRQHVIGQEVVHERCLLCLFLLSAVSASTLWAQLATGWWWGSQHHLPKYGCCEDTKELAILSGLDIEGSQPEWCISTIYHAWNTPFWLGILDIVLMACENNDYFCTDYPSFLCLANVKDHVYTLYWDHMIIS